MAEEMKQDILAKVNDPKDIRLLSLAELNRLAEEIREMMIETVSKRGGHLASSLGTVELTLALHYVFDTPRDRLVWDVGHQAYAHKIITGRKGRFDTLRQRGGISGFPKRAESPYDTFDVGHSGLPSPQRRGWPRRAFSRGRISGSSPSSATELYRPGWPSRG